MKLQIYEEKRAYITRFYSKGNPFKVSYQRNADVCKICVGEMQVIQPLLKGSFEMPVLDNLLPNTLGADLYLNENGLYYFFHLSDEFSSW